MLLRWRLRDTVRRSPVEIEGLSAGAETRTETTVLDP